MGQFSTQINTRWPIPSWQRTALAYIANTASIKTY